jgi:hypothetical protein
MACHIVTRPRSLQVRFVAGERAYLSNTQGGPRMYINIEDYLTYATGKTNKEFQVGALVLSTTAALRYQRGCNTNVTNPALGGRRR